MLVQAVRRSLHGSSAWGQSVFISSRRTYCLPDLLKQFHAGRNVQISHQMLLPTFSARYISTSVLRRSSKPKNTKHAIKPKPVQLGKTKSLRMQRDVVSIRPLLTVAELADLISRDIDTVFEALSGRDDFHRFKKHSSVIDDLEVIKYVVDKCGFRWKLEPKQITSASEDCAQIDDVFKRLATTDEAVLVKRPAIVTIMGHVDHGKTTLLDALRHTNVVQQEFGGITQHIGAFSVALSSGETITFLDTPGHAAFSSMRIRGASVTDIVVLVVAADDGVMQQTTESIRYAHDAGVSIIVAINKIDKPGADVESTKQSLQQHGIQLEGYGGDIQAIPISALKRVNLDALQEAIVALAEVLEIRADPTGLVEAVVIESRTDPGRGKLSTALVRRGTLTKGSVLVAGTAWAKVRGMFNDKGQPISEASPGCPVEILGWRELPSAGEEILEVESEHRAKNVVSYRLRENQSKKIATDSVAIQTKAEAERAEYVSARLLRLEKGLRYKRNVREAVVQKKNVDEKLAEVAIVVKGDVDGSVEAILDVLDTYQSPQCRLHLLSYGVGMVTEQDVEMAAAFNGVVYGFNVPTNAKASTLARTRNVLIRHHDVIYRLIADLRERLTKALPTLRVEEIIGEAKVQADFTVSDGKKKIFVAGCRCIKGVLNKKKLFKLVRDGEVLLQGELSSLKHFKTEVDSIKTDVECGLSFFDQTVSPLPGDVVVCFEHSEKTQELDWDLAF